MRHFSPLRVLSALLLVLLLLAGCSPAPLPPRAEGTPPSPRASAPLVITSASASVPAVTIASAAPVAPPVQPAEDESEDDDPTRGGTALPLEDGAALSIDVDEVAERGAVPEVTLTLSRGGKVVARREGFAAVTGVKPKVLTSAQTCEVWRGSIRRESFGSVSGVRVSIACITGEDYFSATELAVLFRLDGPLRDLGGLPRIWAGLAGAQQSEMDSCVTSRRVDFRLINAKTLEKTITEVGSWTDQEIGGDVKARLKQGCKVGTTKRVERVALP